MKITIEPTTKIVDVCIGETCTPDRHNSTKARIWQGTTGQGVPVTLLVLRVAADRADDNTELERELVEQVPPRAGVEAWPARFVLP